LECRDCASGRNGKEPGWGNERGENLTRRNPVRNTECGQMVSWRGCILYLNWQSIWYSPTVAPPVVAGDAV